MHHMDPMGHGPYGPHGSPHEAHGTHGPYRIHVPRLWAHESVPESLPKSLDFGICGALNFHVLIVGLFILSFVDSLRIPFTCNISVPQIPRAHKNKSKNPIIQRSNNQQIQSFNRLHHRRLTQPGATNPKVGYVDFEEKNPSC